MAQLPTVEQLGWAVMDQESNEGDFSDALAAKLRRLGWKVERERRLQRPSPKGVQNEGVIDLYAEAEDGMALCIECKIQRAESGLGQALLYVEILAKRGVVATPVVAAPSSAWHPAGEALVRQAGAVSWNLPRIRPRHSYDVIRVIR